VRHDINSFTRSPRPCGAIDYPGETRGTPILGGRAVAAGDTEDRGRGDSRVLIQKNKNVRGRVGCSPEVH
jgi:hypothetical protein